MGSEMCIRDRLYVDGFTIKGAQKLLSSKANRDGFSVKEEGAVSNAQTLSAAVKILDDVKIRLAALKQKLNSKIDNPVA